MYLIYERYKMHIFEFGQQVFSSISSKETFYFMQLHVLIFNYILADYEDTNLSSLTGS
jgi:hypothetical protein